MKRGYIRVYRKVRDSFLWKEKPYRRVQAWIDLLMMANHQDTKFIFNDKLIHAKRGEVITSETKLSLRWGWSRSKVGRFLKILESDQMITRELNKEPNPKPNKKPNKRSNIITICNYDIYQDHRTSKRTSKRTSDDTTVEHKEVIREGTKEENYIYSDFDFDFEAFVNYYNSINPPTRIKKFNDGRKHKVMTLLNRGFTKDDFRGVIYRLKTMNKSGYLYGGNQNSFKMDVDWLLNPDNFQKVLEGKYGGNDWEQKIAQEKAK